MREPDEVDGRELAHGVLIAVLMKFGGSLEMTLDELDPDLLGDAAGRFYSFTIEHIGDGNTVRISVRPETNRAEG
ncbi:MAG: hypothetical protein ACRDP6_29250 [Actinoallomurus sp.]